MKTVTVGKSVSFPTVKYAPKIMMRFQFAIPAANVSLGTGENSVLTIVMLHHYTAKYVT